MLAVQILQEAVVKDLQTKAKLGQKAVVKGKNGHPRVISAKSLLKKF